MLGEKGDEAMPARFLTAEIRTTGRRHDAIECAHKQRIDSGLVVRLDGFKPRIKRFERDIGNHGFLTQRGVAAGHGAVPSDLFGRLNSLVERREEGERKAGKAGDIGASRHPAAECRTGGKADTEARQRAKPAPQASVQIVADGIALGVKTSFVKAAGIGLRHGFVLSVRAAAACGLAAAPAPFGQGYQRVPRAFLSSMGLNLQPGYYAGINRRGTPALNGKPDLPP